MSDPTSATLDHLVLAATTLADGIDHFAAVTGVTPRPGGRHVAMGTHNALVTLGERVYLEIIAIDPEGVKPARPRWFEPRRPRAAAELDGAPAAHPLGRAHRRHRAGGRALPGRARSRAPDGARRLSLADHDPRRRHAPGGGLVPTLIEWDVPMHPADSLPASGDRAEGTGRLAPRAGADPRRARGARARRDAGGHLRSRDAARGDAADAAGHRHAVVVTAPRRFARAGRRHSPTGSRRAEPAARPGKSTACDGATSSLRARRAGRRRRARWPAAARDRSCR